jgi:diacylglycerol kinase (ATP)
MKSEMKSFTHAWNGILYAIRSEKHMRFHLLAALLVTVAGWFFNINSTEWCILFSSIGIVIAAEIFNTAFEQLVNLVSPQQHVIAGRVKDLAAGAVLVVSIAALLIGLIIFIPKILSYTF